MRRNLSKGGNYLIGNDRLRERLQQSNRTKDQLELVAEVAHVG